MRTGQQYLDSLASQLAEFHESRARASKSIAERTQTKNGAADLPKKRIR